MIIIYFVVILLTSCSSIPTEEGSFNVYFCPECADELYNILENSNESIHCAFYDLELEEVINILEEKNEEIDVKVVLENDNKLYLDFIRTDNRQALMHNKFCIIDDKIITTGSFNPTERGAYKNNNNFVVIKSKYLVKNYNNEFNEMWSGEFGKGDEVVYNEIRFNNFTIKTLFCPEDDCEENVIKELDKANQSIKFMIFTFTSEKISDKLIEKFDEGIIVEGVFEKFQNNKWCKYDKLFDAGLNVKFDSNSFNMHHKVFIIDDSVVIFGSYNPTKAANERNDENIMIVDDDEVVELFLEEYERIKL